ncbi:hypothetical protein MPSEU_000940500 [Mayamaea pseudoterrestris]|nr:hypothetical protein MPSEU_000940500 [Mayamaea pseudoterrestris]
MLNYFRRQSYMTPIGNRRRSRKLQQDSSSTSAPNGAAAAAGNPDYIDLVNLMDFDVQVARVADAQGDLQSLSYDVSDVVSEWMNDSFRSQLEALGYQQVEKTKGDANNNRDETSKEPEAATSAAINYAQFDAVILIQRNPPSSSSSSDGSNGQRLLQKQPQQKDNAAIVTRLQLRQGRLNQQRQLQAAPRLLQKQNVTGDDDAVPVEQTESPSSNATTSTGSSLLTVELKGAAFFSKNATQMAVPDDVIMYVQQGTMRNQSGLLMLLQQSAVVGLGKAVVDVSAYTVAGNDATGNGGSSDTSSTDDNGQLTMIIYIAVGVAVIAFLFLLLAVLWAWRYDRRHRETYLAGGGVGSGRRKGRRDPSTSAESNLSAEQAAKKTSAAATSNNSKNVIGLADPPISEIGGYGRRIPYNHPEANTTSADNIDVSTSLSQYYRSGSGNAAFASASSPATNNNTSTNTGSLPVRRNNSLNQFNDAASVSSMESYGYSLDGYASTAVGHGELPYAGSYGLDMDSMAKDLETDDDEEESMGPRDL